MLRDFEEAWFESEYVFETFWNIMDIYLYHICIYTYIYIYIIYTLYI